MVGSGTTMWGTSYGGQPEFLAKRCAMYIDGPWIFRELAVQAPKLQYDVAPIPYPDGGVSTNQASIGAYVVYKQSKHKKEAYDFISFLGSREAQAIRVSFLKPSCRPDALKLDAGRATLDRYPQLEKAHEYLAESRIYPLISRWSYIVQILDEEVAAAAQGRKGVEQALKMADSRISKVLAMKSSFK